MHFSLMLREDDLTATNIAIDGVDLCDTDILQSLLPLIQTSHEALEKREMARHDGVNRGNG